MKIFKHLLAGSIAVLLPHLAIAQNLGNPWPYGPFILDQSSYPNVVCIPTVGGNNKCGGSAAPNAFGTWDGTNFNPMFNVLNVNSILLGGRTLAPITMGDNPTPTNAPVVINDGEQQVPIGILNRTTHIFLYPLYSGSFGGTVAGLGANAKGNYDTSIGYMALSASNTTANGGGQNTAIGYMALVNQLSTYSTAVGYNALSLSSVHANTAFGAGAGATITTGGDNNAFGPDAMANDDYIALGSVGSTGFDNTAIGTHSLGHISSGGFNTAIGSEAMVGCGAFSGITDVTCLLTGSHNVAVGNYSLQNVKGAADENTSIGYSSGQSLTTGIENIFLGSFAGDTLTTGSLNILIGRDVRPPSATSSNTLNIGNLITATGLTQGGAAANGAITLHGSLALNGGASLLAPNTTELDIANAAGSTIVKTITGVADASSSTYPVLQANGGTSANIYASGVGSELDIGASAAILKLLGTVAFGTGATQIGSVSATEQDAYNASGSQMLKTITGVSGSALSTYPVLQANGGAAANIYASGVGSELDLGAANTILKFVGIPQYPTYNYSSLPATGSAGREVYCTNCLKPGETTGSGTGMMVSDDGHSHWVSSAGTVAGS